MKSWKVGLSIPKLAFFCIFAIVVILSYQVLLSDRETIDNLIREDGLVENIGAFGLFVASLCFFIAYHRSGKAVHGNSHPAMKRFAYLFLALIFLFGAGEEISWGQRILGFGTPDTWRDINVQEETTLHNIGIFHDEDYDLVNSDRLFALFWGTLMVGIPLVSAVSKKLGPHLRKLVPVFPWWLGLLFVLNYFTAKIVKQLLTSAELYQGTVVSLSQAIVELKESVFGVLFAIVGIYLLRVTLRPTIAPKRRSVN